MDVITSFTGQNRFLSNFHIEPDGTHVEGEFQAAKCISADDRLRFSGLAPGKAKRLGRLITRRPDWEEIKIEIMYQLVRQKFRDHAELASLLIDTEGIELIEGNKWGDNFWGAVNGVGENHLGKILMRVRKELWQEQR